MFHPIVETGWGYHGFLFCIPFSPQKKNSICLNPKNSPLSHRREEPPFPGRLVWHASWRSGTHLKSHYQRGGLFGVNGGWIDWFEAYSGGGVNQVAFRERRRVGFLESLKIKSIDSIRVRLWICSCYGFLGNLGFMEYFLSMFVDTIWFRLWFW